MLYIQNWLLASNALDYLAAANTPSPVEHFCSLSVEEQFYIAWPIIIIIELLWLARFQPRLDRGRVVAGGLIALTVLSFVYSVREVAVDPAAAYFVTFGRA